MQHNSEVCSLHNVCCAAGHSLGAAVATLIGPWAALQWPAADVRVSTFGSPQVGNEAFAQVKIPARTAYAINRTLYAMLCSTRTCNCITLMLNQGTWQLPCVNFSDRFRV